MIDVSKCKYDECYDRDDGSIVYYFSYPVDFDGTRFREEDYTNVVAMEISMEYYDGDFYLEMSPTVETKYNDNVALTDVDWKELYENEDYSLHTIVALMQKVVRALKGEYEDAYIKQSAC